MKGLASQGVGDFEGALKYFKEKYALKLQIIIKEESQSLKEWTYLIKENREKIFASQNEEDGREDSLSGEF